VRPSSARGRWCSSRAAAGALLPEAMDLDTFDKTRRQGTIRGDGASGGEVVATKPWDSRLAHWLVFPLRNTRIHPNHLTTFGLVVGLTAASLFGTGRPEAMNLGAVLFVVSVIFDHADGELARMTGKSSAFGHTYDRVADLIVKLAIFTGMGCGLRAQYGMIGLVSGVLAGGALVAIFLMRSELARRQGPSALVQPAAGGFEIEDILYVVAPMTWLGWLGPFVVAAGIGAPVFALWIALAFRTKRVEVRPR
jgi:archaetidylinositol phosphate synthase